MIFSLIGCHGTTRLIGAGTVVKKNGALFGPRSGEMTQASPKSELNYDHDHKFTYQNIRNPPVPKRDEKPVLGIRTNKNFITANAVQAILQGLICKYYYRQIIFFIIFNI